MESREIPEIMENEKGENKNRNNEFNSHGFIHLTADLIEHLCISYVLYQGVSQE